MYILAVALLATLGLSDSFRHGFSVAGDSRLARGIHSAAQGRLAGSKSMHIIGTRGSPLAQAQAHETKRLLEATFPHMEVDIREIVTKASLHTQDCVYLMFM